MVEQEIKQEMLETENIPVEEQFFIPSEEKVHPFRRFLNFLKSIFLPVSVEEHSVNQEVGNLGSMNREDLSRSYDDVRKAALLCEKSLKIAGMRADLAIKQQSINESLHELEKFEKMTDEEKQYITNILKRYQDVDKEKHSLRGQMSEFTKILDYLEPIEGDIKASLESMDEAEDKQRRLKMDMNYIEGERADLEDQKKDIERNLKYIYKGAIILTVLFSLIAVGLLYLWFGRGIEIFSYALYAAISVIIVATLLYIYRRRLIFEDKMNVALQIRAVELLNRKKVLYVHYTSFLNYEYKKYRVKSAFQLREIWKEFDYYKHVTSRYSNVRNIAYAIEDELHIFLKKHGLQHSKASVADITKLLNFEHNRKEYLRFARQLEVVEGRLAKYEDDQQAVWDELSILKQRDATQEKVVERMIDKYFEDVGKIIPVADEDDKFEYEYSVEKEE